MYSANVDERRIPKQRTKQRRPKGEGERETAANNESKHRLAAHAAAAVSLQRRSDGSCGCSKRSVCGEWARGRGRERNEERTKAEE